jgi:hypothetical protein
MTPRNQMTPIQRFCRLSTKYFVWFAVAIMVVGWAIDAVPGSRVLEYIGSGVFWLGYWFLWLLLPIAAFRPQNYFYLEGDCGLRVKRVGFVAAVLLSVHLLILLSIALIW